MIGLAKAILIIAACIASINFGRAWVLPESQRQRCIDNVHSWHMERVRRIDNLAIDGKIKAEMVEFSQTEKIEQLERVCGIAQDGIAKR